MRVIFIFFISILLPLGIPIFCKMALQQKGWEPLLYAIQLLLITSDPFHHFSVEQNEDIRTDIHLHTKPSVTINTSASR